MAMESSSFNRLISFLSYCKSLFNVAVSISRRFARLPSCSLSSFNDSMVSCAFWLVSIQRFVFSFHSNCELCRNLFASSRSALYCCTWAENLSHSPSLSIKSCTACRRSWLIAPSAPSFFTASDLNARSRSARTDISRRSSCRESFNAISFVL